MLEIIETLEKPVHKEQNMHGKIQKVFRQMFENTCQAIEQLDGKKFIEQPWTRDKKSIWISGESSDDTVYVDRVLHGGNVFEKIGVNYVAIKGEMPSGMSFQKSGALATGAADQVTGDKATPYFATGTSFVIHPHNPMAPIAHVNYRFFQLGDGTQPGYWWFGGGADLTPAYLFEEDAVHFHKAHKEVCDRHDPSYYPRFKKGCDEYFHISHRGESRGIGGIFFDHLNDRTVEELLSFVTDCTEAFVPAYIPLVERRKDMAFTEENKYWQCIVRGRYVEFILTSDRGARFGLASGMVNVQSVFNCMPPVADWKYDDQPTLGTQEAMLREVLKTPREWL
ncbi:coproporphyrinogen III oxidase [Scytonema sp. HK-05]|uniref:oxygen-dependent coproporphyrinogen oxidase n=1 Tax=Scytonema sp. HK-05 TaxID=1137095 RepID=UPI000935B3B5|nr:oxygen-dependent coproporphyrinogen oxidase [Scytonema sp. HK-05]OKH52896.1 coproporphyrinogen III oxidase [Scytonema sp. HK-05]BAY49700.1 coproporphyrinogen III oxidase [Scytonema sp. HK-05]